MAVLRGSCLCGGVRYEVGALAAGTLDDDPGTRPVAHIMVAAKAPWYPIEDPLPQFEDIPRPEDPPGSRPGS